MGSCLEVIFCTLLFIVMTKANCPEVNTFRKLDTTFRSYACVAAQQAINLTAVEGSSYDDQVIYVRRECTKSCMIAEECYVVRLDGGLECHQCRAEFKLLWYTERINYYEVFGSSSDSYVKLTPSGSVQLGDGDCRKGPYGTSFGGSAFTMSPMNRYANKVSGLTVYEMEAAIDPNIPFTHRVALGIAYDGIPVDDITANTEAVPSSENEVQIGQTESVDSILLYLAEEIPVDFKITITVTGSIDREIGPFFTGRYSGSQRQINFRGHNLRSIHGKAGTVLEKIGFSFASC